MRRTFRFLSVSLMSLIVIVAVLVGTLFRKPISVPSSSSPLQNGGMPNAGRTRIIESFRKPPLSFEANQGQTDSNVRFLSRGSGYALFLTANEAVFALRVQSAKSVEETAVLRMKLIGSHPAAPARGLEELPGRSNYFIGKDPKQWRTNVANYNKVQFVGVYPGVDLVYYGNEQQLEYDFVLAPGANPSVITLGFAGAERMEISAQGELALQTPAGEVRWRKPVVYQEIGGVRHSVAGRFVRKTEEAVGFEVAAYDPRHALVIDPILDYSTYLGGSGFDVGSAIAVDSSGKAYVTGTTPSTDFPKTSNAFNVLRGSHDAFVAKFDTTQFGSATRVSSFYLGGSGFDGGNGIAVDTLGNVYVTGTTGSINFPITSNAYQTAFSCCSDEPLEVFVTKLDATGFMVYSTYLGGSFADQGLGIAVDSSLQPNGYAYVTGTASSTNFPTRNALASSGVGFVAKLDTLASGDPSLVYSTYLDFSAGAIAADSSGNAYVTGGTAPGSGTPVFCAPPFCPGVAPDVVVMKISTTGSRAYSVYLPGNGEDIGKGIAVDSSGNAYVTGVTNSTDFPGTSLSAIPAVSPIPIQGTNGGGKDAFVLKLSGTVGSGHPAFLYSTYLGGSDDDDGAGIAVDALGNAHVTGTTRSANFPQLNAFQSKGDAFATDAFVTKLNGSGIALLYSTYLGGNSSDQGKGIALDPSGNAYVAGATSSSNFPSVNQFQFTSGGSSDAFVAKIIDDAPPPAPPTISLSPPSLTFTATAGGANPADQTVAISNSGGGTLNWNASVITGASWLSVSPGAGTGAGTLTASVNITQLAANTYNGSIEVNGTGASNTPQTIAVQLLLTPVVSAQPPTIAKTFTNSTIVLGANTTLTFTLDNPNATALTGVSFTDPLPTGIIVATPNGLTGSCGGTVTAVAGSSSITLTGGTLAANASCAFSVIVKGNSVGLWTNVTSGVNSTEGGLGAAAAASIEVTDPLQNCVGVLTSAYSQQHGGLKKAAAALGYSGVQLMLDAITAGCGR